MAANRCWPGRWSKKPSGICEKNHKNKFHFSLTTNGSLLKKKHILFFKENRFELVLSYDGMAQAKRDPGSVVAVESGFGRACKNFIPKAIRSTAFSLRPPFRCWPPAWKQLMEQGHQNSAIFAGPERSLAERPTWMPWKDSSSGWRSICHEASTKNRQDAVGKFQR